MHPEGRPRAHQGWTTERQKIIDHDRKLQIRSQEKLRDISRGIAYYQLKPIKPRDQTLMTNIDRLHLELPIAGTILDTFLNNFWAIVPQALISTKREM